MQPPGPECSHASVRSPRSSPAQFLKIPGIEPVPRRVLAELQSANVRHDRPSIRRSDAIRIGIHHSVSITDHIVEVAVRRFAEHIGVKARRRRKASLHDHAVAVSAFSMAGCTVDVEPLTAALQETQGDRGLLWLALAVNRYASCWGSSRAAAVCKQRARRPGFVLWLLVHVMHSALTPREAERTAEEERCRAPHEGTVSM